MTAELSNKIETKQCFVCVEMENLKKKKCMYSMLSKNECHIFEVQHKTESAYCVSGR